MAKDQTDETTELDVTYDAFISFAVARNREDAERASTAGESRQQIGEFLEETGLNGKAVSFARSILKTKKFGKQMDTIRSIKEILPHVEAYVLGQGGPELPLAPPADPVSDDEAELQQDEDDFTDHLAEVAEAAE